MNDSSDNPGETVKPAVAGAFRLRACQVFTLRVPIKEPVRTSFGMMTDRPAVLISLSDHDGHTGWGEIWCNFPAVGAQHRARLFESEVKPLLLQHDVNRPDEIFTWLTERLHLLVNQSGEDGPVAQVIAGTDMALWDLYARRAGVPLWDMLGGQSRTVQCYASGINPSDSAQTAVTQFNHGYRAFKLKVGFDDDLDVANARAIRAAVGPDCPIMLDANQAWSLDRAKRMTARLAEIEPHWIEEPLAVDAPLANWQQLSASSPVPLAGGENLRGIQIYEQIIESGVFRYIQPDAAKWGGVSGCLQVARLTQDAGLCYCPHWLGAGVGLMASAHLLVASGSDGWLEVDSNPNPLRDELIGGLPSLHQGCWHLSDQHGHGAVPDNAVVDRYRHRHS